MVASADKMDVQNPSLNARNEYYSTTWNHATVAQWLQILLSEKSREPRNYSRFPAFPGLYSGGIGGLEPPATAL